MIDKKSPINEYSFILTMNNLRSNILHSIYHIYDKNDEKIIKKFEEVKKEINNDIMTNNFDPLQESIINLKNELEITKLAGQEMNKSFQKFNDDLKNLNESLM